MRTADEGGYTTKVTRLGTGKYGCRVLLDGKVVSEQVADTREEVGGVLKEMLRMIAKCGHPSPMAKASRKRIKR